MSILNIDSREKPLWLVAVIAHLVAAIFSNGFYHWDEHFQIFEFSDYLLGLGKVSDLPWEFEAKMRPLILPYLAAGVKFVLGDSFISAGLMRVLATILSLVAVKVFYDHVKESLSVKAQQVFIFSSCLLWFMPFLHVRISAEVIGGALFIIAYTQVFKRSLLSGFLFAMSFWIRFQMGFAILGLFLPFFFKRELSFKKIALIGAGFLLGVGINVGFDSIGYGEMVFSPWSYLNENIILGKSKNFGVNPVTDYFKWLLLKPGLPIGLLIYFSLWKRFKNNFFNPLNISLLLFFIAHLAVGHKEFRFLFPMIFILPLLFAELSDDPRFSFLKNKKFQYGFIALNALPLLIYSTTPAHTVVNFQKFVIKNEIKEMMLKGETNPYFLAGLKVNYYDKQRPKIEDASKHIFGDRLKHARKAKSEGCMLEYSSQPLKTLFIDKSILKDKTKVWTIYRCN